MFLLSCRKFHPWCLAIWAECFQGTLGAKDFHLNTDTVNPPARAERIFPDPVSPQWHLLQICDIFDTVSCKKWLASRCYISLVKRQKHFWQKGKNEYKSQEKDGISCGCNNAVIRNICSYRLFQQNRWKQHSENYRKEQRQQEKQSEKAGHE